MSEQQAEEIIEALEEPVEQPKKTTRKKTPAPEQASAPPLSALAPLCSVASRAKPWPGPTQ